MKRKTGTALLVCALLLSVLCGCQNSREEESGVYTDWSKLTERGKVEPLYSRAYDGYTPELIAKSEGYGPLLPYAGIRLMDDWPANRGFLYGLVTSGGEIVTDPVFTSVERMELKGEPVLLLRSAEVLRVEGHDYDSAYTNWYVAAADGSWVTDALPGNLIEGEDVALVVGPEGFIRVDHQGVVTPYSWETLGYAQDAPFWRLYWRNACGTSDYIASECFCHEETRGWHIYDLHTGELNKVHLEPGVYPDFEWGGAELKAGLICAWAGDQSEEMGVLDRNGNWVLPPAKRQVYTLEGYIIAYDQDYKYFLYDSDGTLRLESPYTLDCYAWEGGTFFVKGYYQEDEDGGYTETGRIYDQNFELSSLNERNGKLAAHGWFWDFDEHVLLRGEARIALPEELRGKGRHTDILQQGDIFLALIHTKGGLTESLVLSQNGEILYHETGESNPSVEQEVYGGESYIYTESREGDQVIRRILNLKGEELGRLSSDRWGETFSIVGGMLYLEIATKSELRSLDGELVFCYPIPDFSDD